MWGFFYGAPGMGGNLQCGQSTMKLEIPRLLRHRPQQQQAQNRGHQPQQADGHGSRADENGSWADIGVTIESLSPPRRRWTAYFRWTQVIGALGVLDRWIRRKLRSILWRQSKKPYTRAKNLMEMGLSEERAFRPAFNQRGPSSNSGGSHMNHVFPKKYLDQLDPVSVLEKVQRLQCSP